MWWQVVLLESFCLVGQSISIVTALYKSNTNWKIFFKPDVHLNKVLYRSHFVLSVQGQGHTWRSRTLVGVWITFSNSSSFTSVKTTCSNIFFEPYVKTKFFVHIFIFHSGNWLVFLLFFCDKVDLFCTQNGKCTTLLLLFLFCQNQQLLITHNYIVK